MVLKADQQRVKALLKETITLLCKNGLNYKSQFAIEALIGITLDEDDVFLISIKESINGGMGVLDMEVGSPKRDFQVDISTGGGDSLLTDDVSNVDSNASDGEASNSNSSRKTGKRRRRRRFNDLPDAKQPEDQKHTTDFDVDNAQTEVEAGNLDNTYATTEVNDEQSADKKCRLKEEVDDDDDNDDDELIIVKEEKFDVSDIQQQSYLSTDNTYPAFSAATSWSTDLSQQTNNTMPSPRRQQGMMPQFSQHGNMDTSSQQMSMSQSGPHTNTPQMDMSQMDMSQQLDNSQAAQQMNTSQEQMSNEKRFPCPICHKGFSTRRTMHVHMGAAHMGRYLYYCEFCGRGFSSSTNLRGHVVSHTGVREFRCAYCKKDFKYAQNLKQHMFVHIGEQRSLALDKDSDLEHSL